MNRETAQHVKKATSVIHLFRLLMEKMPIVATALPLNLFIEGLLRSSSQL